MFARSIFIDKRYEEHEKENINEITLKISKIDLQDAFNKNKFNGNTEIYDDDNNYEIECETDDDDNNYEIEEDDTNIIIGENKRENYMVETGNPLDMIEYYNKTNDYSNYPIKENIRKILSIDIGINNLALTVAIVNQDYTLHEILWVNRIDITTFPHRHGVTKETCKLHHDKTIFDWIEHVIVYYQEFFDQCDKILIERQPPQGLVSIEQLLFGMFRHKTVLVHPCSMHKFFKIGHLDYEQRKNAVEQICIKYIQDEEVKHQIYSFDRKHDIADSICLLIYWLDTQNKKYINITNKERIMNQKMLYGQCKDMTFDEFFEQFKYRSIHKSY